MQETKRILQITDGAAENACSVFRNQFGEQPALLVADTNTMSAAGEQIVAQFRKAQHPIEVCCLFFDPNLYAEYGFVEQLQAALQARTGIAIAVGSGTINDLTKVASHNLERPYMCVATAASMDGYTAFGASITFQGSKQQFPCPPPVAVLADLDIISAAPAEMNAWGYADLLAKVASGADWILAEAAGVEPIHPKAWEIVQGSLRQAVGDPVGVRTGRKTALAGLTDGLMQAGFAMEVAQSSRPASGAEHQFSHLWDMQNHKHGSKAPAHGLKVGLATLASTALYEALLRRPIADLDIDQCCNDWPGAAYWEREALQQFGQGNLLNVALRELAAKPSASGDLRGRLQRLKEQWPATAERLRSQLIPFPKLKSMLREAGAATEPSEIGLTVERLRRSYRQAYMIRRRYTVLDLAVELNVLDELLGEIFDQRNMWS